MEHYLMDDNILWKKTFNGGQLEDDHYLMDDNILWKKTFYGGQLEDDPE